MKLARVLAAYIAVVFLGGALVAPWIYRGATALGESLPAVRSATQQPFHRYINRCLLGLALVGAWPLARRFGLRTWRDAGWAKPAGKTRELVGGLGLGFVSLGLVALIALVCGARHYVAVGNWVPLLLSAAGTAIFVAALEETFFRGVLYGGLRRELRDTPALVLSSGVYAIVHFFAKPANPVQVDWTSGFGVLGGMLAGFGDFHAVIPGFLTLFVAGAVLAMAYQRTGNLWFSIGLHAAWIFWLKIYGAATDATSLVPSWFWGSSRMLDGWIAFLAVTLAAACSRDINRWSVCAGKEARGGSDKLETVA